MKHVLVTGCSSGIGRCIADGLKERGFNVFVTARKQEDIDALSKADFEVIMLDLADTESIQAAVLTLLSKTNDQLYGLINNAAYGLIGAMEDIPIMALRDQFEINIFGTQKLTNLLIPVMRKQNSGRIIQISSVLGFITMKFRGSYCASKYALEAISDAMRYELNNTGINVSLIEPGPITSNFRNNALNNFQVVVNKEHSHFKEDYTKIENELRGNKYNAPFSLGPEVVLKHVVHALESDNPKARYLVTFPTYLFAVLKRILPEFLLDKILARV
ncbi:MAG: short-chain dehydrogenase [Legionellales bacterium]|nr:short-chain dehydrogenase [Legionellales bacterium]|tara:strand:- start:1239 stop:2060 length:822 start_codon:yes stop_codon:yes gene_type:complete